MKAKEDLQADYMVISPHPDDSEFGAAGSVARWVSEGKTVVYVICTGGEKGTSDPDLNPADLARVRIKEQRSAAELLGVSEVIFLGYEDQTLEDTPVFRKDIVRWIRKFRPHTVVTADPYRRYLWHRDHRITGQVVLDAVFPFARDYHAYPDLIAEGLMPHKVRRVLLWASEDPDYYSDISQTFDKKLAALRCHESQVGGHHFASVEKWLRQRAEEAAREQDFELAEAFHLVDINR